jgi:hypothetical protein
MTWDDELIEAAAEYRLHNKNHAILMYETSEDMSIEAMKARAESAATCLHSANRLEWAISQARVLRSSINLP